MLYIYDQKYNMLAKEIINNIEYMTIISDIIKNENFKKIYNIEHHGISRWEHLIKISYYSYKIAKKLNFDYKSVARGALLHDFYLDGDERSKINKFIDTFIHPKKALKTSMNNFEINKIEKNIIISHMFPIYPSIPTFKESILVNLVDKVIGSSEMMYEYRYKFKYKFNYLFVLLLVIIGK